MVLIILLLVAIVLLISAAGVAIRLVRVTKYNSSWILFIFALLIMCIQSISLFVGALDVKYDLGWGVVFPPYLDGWFWVASSLCFAVGMFMIKKVLSYITLREQQQRLSEKRILSAVIQAEERQRQKLSKELHDGLGPLLSAAKMSLSALSKGNRSDSERQIIETADNAISIAVRSLRDVSNLLSPHILVNFGLQRAVGKHIKNLQSLTELSIEFGSNIEDRRFDNEKEIIIYRVVCELINNTFKHASASRITLSINEIQGVLTIDYSDNGIGFDTEDPTEGMGLRNILSRVSTVGGEVDIVSRPKHGMKVHIKIK